MRRTSGLPDASRACAAIEGRGLDGGRKVPIQELDRHFRIAVLARVNVRVAVPSWSIRHVQVFAFVSALKDRPSGPLRRGAYAVQLEQIEDIKKLLRRHGPALRITSPSGLQRRLKYQPVPLAVGVSRTSAEQLASDAREAGAEARVVHTRALLGPRLKASQASIAEAAIALGLHYVVTVGLGWALVSWFEVATLPALVSIAGLVAVMAYTRRPLLRTDRQTAPRTRLESGLGGLKKALGALNHDRSRRLAAQAFSRAAPVLGDAELKTEVVHRLSLALQAIARADTHQSFLLAHPRSALARDLESAEARAERGDQAAIEELRALRETKAELTEAAIAYDVEGRAALEECENIGRY